MLCLQVARARKTARVDDSTDQPVDTELKRTEADEPIKLSLAASAARGAAAAPADKQQSRSQAAAPPMFGDDEGGWKGRLAGSNMPGSGKETSAAAFPDAGCALQLFTSLASHQETHRLNWLLPFGRVRTAFDLLLCARCLLLLCCMQMLALQAAPRSSRTRSSARWKS